MDVMRGGTGCFLLVWQAMKGSCTLDEGFSTALLLQARTSSHYHHTQTILNGITNNNVFLPVGKLIHAFKLDLNFAS